MILDLVLEGRTNQSIAERLYLSKRSLEVRLTVMYAALGVAGKSDLRRLRQLPSVPESPSSTTSSSTSPPITPVLTVVPSTRGVSNQVFSTDGLSTEERAILKLVLDGQTNQEIASRLYLSKRSVELRLTTIYRALRVTRKSELRQSPDQGERSGSREARAGAEHAG